MSYAELHCLSNFSFQRGASSALELFERAKRQGYSALAITDECSLSGIVRAWQAAQAVELPLIIGSEVRLENGPKLVLLVQDLSGYQQLCRLITLARRRAEKALSPAAGGLRETAAVLLRCGSPKTATLKPRSNGCAAPLPGACGWRCIALRPGRCAPP